MDQKMTKCQVVPQRTRNEPKANTVDNFFKGGSPPRYPKYIFLSSLSESRGRDSFKGGSLSHPKNFQILECENY
jgi:hypothetical protein